MVRGWLWSYKGNFPILPCRLTLTCWRLKPPKVKPWSRRHKGVWVLICCAPRNRFPRRRFSANLPCGLDAYLTYELNLTVWFGLKAAAAESDVPLSVVHSKLKCTRTQLSLYGVSHAASPLFIFKLCFALFLFPPVHHCQELVLHLGTNAKTW